MRQGLYCSGACPRPPPETEETSLLELQRALVRAALTAALACAGPLLGGAALHAQKTDVIVLFNGDRITGEIKQLARGKLTYSTDDLAIIYIEWDKIVHVTSANYFEIQLETGRKYYGTLGATTEPGVIVVTLQRADTLALAAVVSIDPIRAEFWQRFRGYLDVGFNFAKANRNLQLTTAGEARYRVVKGSALVGFDTYYQKQTDVEPTSRNSLRLQGELYPKVRWAVGVLTELQQNDELGLALRATLSGGAFRTLVQDNRAELRAGAGLTVNRERFQDTDSTTYGLEGLLGAQLLAFRYDRPKLDLDVGLSLYPSFTVQGRIRAEFDSRVKYEVLKDFMVGVTFTYSYDSRPPSETVAKNDFVASFTIGWTFGGGRY